MQTKIEKSIFLIFCIYSLFFFIGSTLAPLFAHFQQYDTSAKLTYLYMHSCHQQPDRSFWILKYPVALCCRCYGFYLGVALSTIFTLFNKIKFNYKQIIPYFIIVLIDITFNCILKINTGNITRFIVGTIMGLLYTLLLCVAMKLIKEKHNNAH